MSFALARLALVAAAAVWLAPAAGRAAPEPLALPPVEVEGARPGPDDRTAATSSAPVDHAAAPRSLGDVLEPVPGLDVRSQGGPGQRENVLLRGTDAQQTLVLFDGFRLNPAAGGGVDLALVHPALLERVDVFRGPFSARFGSDALGGAVNLVPRSPGRDPFGAARLTFGSFGTLQGDLTAAGRSGPLGLLGVAGFRLSQGDFEFEDVNFGLPGVARRVRRNNHARSEFALGRLTFDLSPRHRLAALTQLAVAERGLPGVEQFPSEHARQRDLQGLWGLRYEGRDLGMRGLGVRAEAALRLTRFHFRDETPALLLQSGESRIRTLRGEGAAELRLSHGVQRPLRARLEAAYETAHAEAHAAMPGGPLTQNIAPTRATAGLLVADDLRLAAGRLTLSPAVRLDWAADFGLTAVPRLGVACEPTPGLTLRLAGGRAYRMPSFDELYVDLGAVKGNPELGPETAWGVDGGVQWRRGPVTFDVGAFYERVAHLILFLPRTATQLVADGSHSATLWGLEAEQRFSPVPWLETALSVSYLHARFVGSGLPLPGRPSLRWVGRLTLRPGRFAFYVQGSHEGPFVYNRLARRGEPARTRLDAGIRAQALDWLTFALDGRNLTDVRDAVDQYQFPLPGLSVFASAAAAW